MSKGPMISHRKSVLRSVFLAAALTIGAAAFPLSVRAQADRGGMPGDFDYYVLALSWSPTYCSGQGADRGEYDRDRDYDDHGT